MTSNPQVLYDTVLRAQAALHQNPTIEQIFREDAHLVITPSNNCDANCLHCVSNATSNGQIMSFRQFDTIPPEFLKLFPYIDFGRKGDPITYQDDKKDLADIIEKIEQQHPKEFSIAIALHESEPVAVAKLAKLTTTIKTMITYHHYFQDLDTKALARKFNTTLHHAAKYSDAILISLAGDDFSLKQPTMAQEVTAVFEENKSLIFKGFEISQETHNPYTYSLQIENQFKNKKIELKIPPIDTRIYSLGRFRQYLKDQGTLVQYEKEFAKKMGEYTCPDMITWPGIILEPNGDLNLCGSYEAINCKNAVVTNIFKKPYQQVQQDLLNLRKRELAWFVQNIDDIMNGKVPMCKLENKCYTI